MRADGGVKESNLVFFTEIARANGHPEPERIAREVMDRWGDQAQNEENAIRMVEELKGAWR